ncbi:MAG: CDP-glucose 4,6-dehydratase [Ferruginibacter sp.]
MEKVVDRKNLASFYDAKKVFVTGHTGFKGSWLITWLQLLGATVKGYALTPEYKECFFNSLPESFCESTIADIRDKEKLKAAITSFQPDYIFHLAAQPLVRKSYYVPAETFEVNVVGTANLLEAVNQMEKKSTIVIITTDKVYENKEQDVLYKETDSLGGYDPYSASKACAEIVVNSFRNSFFNPVNYISHQKAIATARAGNVIGGGDFSTDRIVPDIIRSLRQKRSVEVRSPNSVRPWQHVLEPLFGYLLLGGLLNNDPAKFSDAFNFGPKPGDHLTVKELVELAIKTWGNGEWKIASTKDQPHEAGILKLDISKAENDLQWYPKLEAAQAVEWTINWYKQNKSEVLHYTNTQINNYMNL